MTHVYLRTTEYDVPEQLTSLLYAADLDIFIDPGHGDSLRPAVEKAAEEATHHIYIYMADELDIEVAIDALTLPPGHGTNVAICSRDMTDTTISKVATAQSDTALVFADFDADKLFDPANLAELWNVLRPVPHDSVFDEEGLDDD